MADVLDGGWTLSSEGLSAGFCFWKAVHQKTRDLFDPITPPEKRHPLFEGARTWPQAEGARMMMNEIFATFHDADGNFVEQFQTTGYDARTFELYLHAYLSRSGFAVDRSHDRPDFIVSSTVGRAAVEVTTSNRARSFDFEQIMEDLKALTPEVQRERMRGEFPIRLGGPLFDKLKKKYWNLPQCTGLPLVLAIEPFHDTTSLFFTSSALADYLYGVRHESTRDADGNLVITGTPIESHSLGEKTIPSGFFNLPDAENISAVVFSNSGTFGKFTRMAYQAGYERGDLLICRSGLCHDHDPKASEPSEFFYWMHDPFHVESWGEGLEVYHNPRALIPLPRTFFPDAADNILKNGVISSLVPSFHPFMSQMSTFGIKGFERSRDHGGLVIDSIMRCEFEQLALRRGELLPNFREREWLADRARTMLATLVEDTDDGTWWFAVVSPRGSMINMASGLPDRDAARDAALDALVAAVQQPA